MTPSEWGHRHQKRATVASQYLSCIEEHGDDDVDLNDGYYEDYEDEMVSMVKMKKTAESTVDSHYFSCIEENTIVMMKTMFMVTMLFIPLQAESYISKNWRFATISIFSSCEKICMTWHVISLLSDTWYFWEVDSDFKEKQKEVKKKIHMWYII